MQLLHWIAFSCRRDPRLTSWWVAELFFDFHNLPWDIGSCVVSQKFAHKQKVCLTKLALVQLTLQCDQSFATVHCLNDGGHHPAAHLDGFDLGIIFFPLWQNVWKFETNKNWSNLVKCCCYLHLVWTSWWEWSDCEPPPCQSSRSVSPQQIQDLHQIPFEK